MSRLAAFDMDGTLLLPNHQFGSETLASLHSLHARGVILAFATGRHLLEMKLLAENLGLAPWLITGNGTRIHTPEGEKMFGQDLPPAVAEMVIHHHWNTTASMHIFNDRGWFTDKPVAGLLDAHQMSGFSYQLQELKRMSAHDVTKVCFIAPHETLCELQWRLNQALGHEADTCFSARDCLEVLPPKCNKGAALMALTTHLGVDMAECMAFGDAMNDHQMLASVGKGFVMGNAMAQLKAVLPHLPVIGHCETQGVSHYLNHWLATPHLQYSPE
ncbi:HMP-PP phosphatase [Enterobacterales bacterium CwR94]|nr:HMP-PP phosphatase [Enterobacterales bacterium CwR94]